MTVTGTDYVPVHASALVPCSTAAIAARRRARWADWSFSDDRERHCRRVVQQGEVYVLRPESTLRFCVGCAEHVLQLPVRIVRNGSAGGDVEAGRMLCRSARIPADTRRP